ncbi:MAG: type II CRISPR-associated endonuclease Cas1 [Planctomycetota bacterium]
MIKRTIEISQQPMHLTARNGQLLLLRKDEPATRLPANPPNLAASIPCEDIGVVMVEHSGTTFSHAALSTLLANDAALVICGRDHLPCGMILPIADHSEIVHRLHQQIEIKKPLRKQLWKQIVQEKIRAQAANLPQGSSVRSHLLALARNVRSGDPSNVEAQAARAYWRVWLERDEGDINTRDFRRDPAGDPPNNLLNYGYAIMRAAVARAIVSAGLNPALGIHHSHRANAFCLADDLMEPLRPIVDDQARELFNSGCEELTPPTKAALLELLTVRVRTGDTKGPLMVGLHRLVASLVRCYEGVEKRLIIPVACVDEEEHTASGD